MKHLCTGSKGFIGQHLMRALGDDAVGVDLPECDVTAFVSDTSAVWRDIHHAQPETVWHLAALNDATQTFYDRPWDVLNTQIRGTLNVLDACVANGVKTLVLFSSSEVYQTPPVVPTPEDVPLVVPDLKNPRYSYGGGKIAAELLAWHSKIPRVIIIRPHNVFGEGQRPGHVITDLLASFASGRPVFRGDPSATRAFLHVSDFVSGCMTIARHHERDERTREVYNVGSDQEIRVFMLARHIEAAMTGDRGNEITIEPGPEGGTVRRCPDVSKLKALGWKPQVDVIDAVRALARKAAEL